MVCDACEKKLSKVIVPDKWKDGARNTTGGSDGGRHVGSRNSLLEVRGATQRFRAGVKGCGICKSKVAQDANYCQTCAFHKVRAECGRAVCCCWARFVLLAIVRKETRRRAGTSRLVVASSLDGNRDSRARAPLPSSPAFLVRSFAARRSRLARAARGSARCAA